MAVSPGRPAGFPAGSTVAQPPGDAGTEKLDRRDDFPQGRAVDSYFGKAAGQVAPLCGNENRGHQSFLLIAVHSRGGDMGSSHIRIPVA